MVLQKARGSSIRLCYAAASEIRPQVQVCVGRRSGFSHTQFHGRSLRPGHSQDVQQLWLQCIVTQSSSWMVCVPQARISSDLVELIVVIERGPDFLLLSNHLPISHRECLLVVPRFETDPTLPHASGQPRGHHHGPQTFDTGHVASRCRGPPSAGRSARLSQHTSPRQLVDYPTTFPDFLSLAPNRDSVNVRSTHPVLPIDRLHRNAGDVSWRALRKAKRRPYRCKSSPSGVSNALCRLGC